MKLITHNERFHYDEVLASCILLRIYPDAEIVRTRDKTLIDSGDIVYDVGGVFDPGLGRFDHHQRTFFETFSPKYSVKLSSSGLIFKYFHRKLLSLYGIESSSRTYDLVVDKIYSEFFLYADAIDNGQDIYGEIKPRSIADLVNLFNVDGSGRDAETEGFYEVLRIVDKDLDNYMKRIKLWTDNYEHMENKIKETSGPILVLDKHYSTDLVLEIEAQNGKDFKFMVFPHRGAYRVIAIPKHKGTFETKNPLRKEWRGLVNEELVEASGIEGCTFVHSSGFMGINSTLENALKMCTESLPDDEDPRQ
ncbi:MYG1 protein [Encephalitozoon cuniculi]|nr:MYG1 protein [Encephalitozoon cuniculi]